MQHADEMKELIKKLKPYVTFTHAILNNGKEGEQVTCGGVIKQIVDMSVYGDTSKEPIVYVTLDDGLGSILTVVPRSIWTSSTFVLGDTVLATGILYSLKKENTFMSEANNIIKVKREDEPLRVLVMDINHLN